MRVSISSVSQISFVLNRSLSLNPGLYSYYERRIVYNWPRYSCAKHEDFSGCSLQRWFNILHVSVTNLRAFYFIFLNSSTCMKIYVCGIKGLTSFGIQQVKSLKISVQEQIHKLSFSNVTIFKVKSQALYLIKYCCLNQAWNFKQRVIKR